MMRGVIAAGVFATQIAYAGTHETDPTIEHANHIFNEVHNSARQFGSSLHHNGMSVFLATVPEGVEFYHGAVDTSPVVGTEWLSFEPEHALIFVGPPPSERCSPSAVLMAEHESDLHTSSSPTSKLEAIGPSLRTGDQKPMIDHDEDGPGGFLQTYRARHPLRLLYVSGQSAAKSTRGTLDLQDLVLLHRATSHDVAEHGRDEERMDRALPRQDTRPGIQSPRNPMEDYERARDLCRTAEHEWRGAIDGFMRMEGGFEIVLCHVEQHLDLVRATHTEESHDASSPCTDPFSYYQAVAARYDGIGGRRAQIDSDDYVSLYTYPDLVYFDKFGNPRVNGSSAAIPEVRDAVRRMLLRHHDSNPTDWQAVTDMIVGRYVARIDYLASGTISSPTQFRAEASNALRPFVDNKRRNETAELNRCREHFMPLYPEWRTPAATAILQVSTVLCKALLSIEKVDTLAHGMSVIRTLKDWLAWPEWKRCKNCEVNEICFPPIWPLGTADDLERPKCINNMKDVGSSYWRPYSDL